MDRFSDCTAQLDCRPSIDLVVAVVDVLRQQRLSVGTLPSQNWIVSPARLVSLSLAFSFSLCLVVAFIEHAVAEAEAAETRYCYGAHPRAHRKRRRHQPRPPARPPAAIRIKPYGTDEWPLWIYSESARPGGRSSKSVIRPPSSAVLCGWLVSCGSRSEEETERRRRRRENARGAGGASGRDTTTVRYNCGGASPREVSVEKGVPPSGPGRAVRGSNLLRTQRQGASLHYRAAAVERRRRRQTDEQRGTELVQSNPRWRRLRRPAARHIMKTLDSFSVMNTRGAPARATSPPRNEAGVDALGRRATGRRRRRGRRTNRREINRVDHQPTTTTTTTPPQTIGSGRMQQTAAGTGSGNVDGFCWDKNRLSVCHMSDTQRSCEVRTEGNFT